MQATTTGDHSTKITKVYWDYIIYIKVYPQDHQDISESLNKLATLLHLTYLSFHHVVNKLAGGKLCQVAIPPPFADAPLPFAWARGKGPSNGSSSIFFPFRADIYNYIHDSSCLYYILYIYIYYVWWWSMMAIESTLLTGKWWTTRKTTLPPGGGWSLLLPSACTWKDLRHHNSSQDYDEVTVACWDCWKVQVKNTFSTDCSRTPLAPWPATPSLATRVPAHDAGAGLSELQGQHLSRSSHRFAIMK